MSNTTKKKIISLEVRDEYILGSGVAIGAVGSHASILLRIKFNENWDALNIHATWTDALGKVGEDYNQLLLPSHEVEERTYEIGVPAFATRHSGTVRLSFSGFVIGEDGEEISQVKNTASGLFKVLDSNAVRLDDEKIDATYAEQVQTELNEMGEDMEAWERRVSAVKAAEETRDTAEAQRQINEYGAAGNRYDSNRGCVVNADGDEVENDQAGRVGAELEREAAENERKKKTDVIGCCDTEVSADNATALGFGTKAGGRGFKIVTEQDNGDGTGVYGLYSVEGLAVGMRYSVRLSTAGYDLGEITAISGNKVTVNGYTHRTMVDEVTYPDDPESCYVSNYLSIVGRPDLGDTVIGFNATAFGENTIATDRDAFAEGRETKAIGQYSHTEGHSTMAGFASHAEGRETNATGEYAHAEGYKTNALGERSHAEGSGTTASGIASHSEGFGTVASEHSSHAEGYQTNATGKFSHAEGANNTASGQQAHAEGENNVASGYASHAEGLQVVASGKIAHAEGEWTKATAEYSHAEGYYSKAFGARSHAEGCNTTASGYASHVEGEKTNATSDYSHAEGYNTSSTKPSAHAEGYSTQANGAYSHTEGYLTKSTSTGGHAEGNSTQAGYFAHSEGESTIASGSHSHAEGLQTKASAHRSHAEGQGTVATVEAQHVQGKFNAIDANGSAGNFAHVVGGGTSDANRKNIHTLDWSGNAMFAGSLTLGNVTISKEQLQKLLALIGE